MKNKEEYLKLSNIGIKKRNLGDYQGAIADLTKAIELEPNNSYAYFNRGVAKDDLKDYQGAIMDYTKAIEFNPNYAETYFNRGVAKAKVGNYQGARDDYTKSIELDPNYADAYFNRGRSKYESENYKGAISDLNKVIELDPDNINAYFYRGTSKFNLGDDNGAQKDTDYYYKLKDLDYKNQNMKNKAIRNNDRKPKWSLVHQRSLIPMVRVLEYGANKYEPYNWMKGLSVTETCESMKRHLDAFMEGEIYDTESGLSHIGHILANGMFAEWMMKNKPEFYDIYKNE